MKGNPGTHMTTRDARSRDTIALAVDLVVALVVALIGALAFAPRLVAHHSFAAEFDASKTITLKGVVTKVEWTNPHIWVYLDVKDDQGNVQQWQCEGGPPNTLTRNGWSVNSLKANDQVTIDGVLAKDSSKTCNARLVKLPDGRSVFAGSSGGDGPRPPRQ